MEWSIQQVAKSAGTTSRTLRHYDEVGLLPPSRVAANGHRQYDRTALVRLQRILLLRDLGLGLPDIAEVLARETTEERALERHLAWLQDEQTRLTRQIASVRNTIQTMRGGEQMTAEEMFDGFDHTRYREEVERRWGADAHARGDDWWRSQSPSERAEFQERTARLAEEWQDAAARGVPPDGDEAQALAARHVAWLESIPGTPGADADYVAGLGDMYVADERFAANYGGQTGATFVRDALAVYAAGL